MTAQELAETIRNIILDKKGRDVEVLDLAGKTLLTDFFVVATGNSTTHIRALSDAIEKSLKDQYGRYPERIEGKASGRWLLLDYADVVVHLFHASERSFYNLEKLWRGQSQF